MIFSGAPALVLIVLVLEDNDPLFIIDVWKYVLEGEANRFNGFLEVTLSDWENSGGPFFESDWLIILRVEVEGVGRGGFLVFTGF